MFSKTTLAWRSSSASLLPHWRRRPTIRSHAHLPRRSRRSAISQVTLTAKSRAVVAFRHPTTLTTHCPASAALITPTPIGISSVQTQAAKSTERKVSAMIGRCQLNGWGGCVTLVAVPPPFGLSYVLGKAPAGRH